MPSLLARIRQRTHSQSSTASPSPTSSTPATSPITTSFSTSASPPELPQSSSLSSPPPPTSQQQYHRRTSVSRKIHPDLNTLLEAYTPKEDEGELSPGGGLRPSVRRFSTGSYGSGSGSGAGVKVRGGLEPSAEEEDADLGVGVGTQEGVKEDGEARGLLDPLVAEDPPKTPRRVFSRLPQFGVSISSSSPVPWSTFGRNKFKDQTKQPPISDFLSRSPSRSHSVRTAGGDGVSVRRSTSTKSRDSWRRWNFGQRRNSNIQPATAGTSQRQSGSHSRASTAPGIVATSSSQSQSQQLSTKGSKQSLAGTSAFEQEHRGPTPTQPPQTGTSRPRSNTTPSSNSNSHSSTSDPNPQKPKSSFFRKFTTPATPIIDANNRVDSPNTFGHPTPLLDHAPSLDHPQLIAALSRPAHLDQPPSAWRGPPQISPSTSTSSQGTTTHHDTLIHAHTRQTTGSSSHTHTNTNTNSNRQTTTGSTQSSRSGTSSRRRPRSRPHSAAYSLHSNEEDQAGPSKRDSLVPSGPFTFGKGMARSESESLPKVQQIFGEQQAREAEGGISGREQEQDLLIFPGFLGGDGNATAETGEQCREASGDRRSNMVAAPMITGFDRTSARVSGQVGDNDPETQPRAGNVPALLPIPIRDDTHDRIDDKTFYPLRPPSPPPPFPPDSPPSGIQAVLGQVEGDPSVNLSESGNGDYSNYSLVREEDLMMSGQRDASMMSRSEGGGGESAGAMKRPMRKQSRSEHTPLPSSTSAPPSSPAPSSIPTPNSKPKSAHAGPSTSKSSPMMLSPPSLAVIAPTPEGSPGGSLRGSASPVADSSSNGALAMPPPSEKSIGKRKADDLETTPPKTAEKEGKKGHRATFALDTPSRERTSHRASESAHAPSAYSSPSRKRPRMSSASPNTTPSHSRPGSAGREGSHSSTSRTYHNQNLQPPSTPTPQRTRSAASSRSSPPSQQHHRSQSEKDPPTPTRTSVDRRRSLSAASMTIPMSAIITPHAPSVTRSNNPGSLYHMRDPRKSPRIQETGWSLRFRDRDGGEEGSGLHAWAFFVGFLIFPLWWVVSWFGVPTTRRLEGGDAEKRVVVVDDPQIEHDAKVWRFRCRVAAVLSFFTYIPFIILIAIFVSRKV